MTASLRTLTPARVALSRTGASIATKDLLDFQLAHAKARDSVHLSLQTAGLMDALRSIPAVASLPDPKVLALSSCAADRQSYLQRPDLGRKLNAASLKRITDLQLPGHGFGLAIVLADGLSALAIERHAVPLLAELLPHLIQSESAPSPAPISVVEQGRVAVGDDVARAFRAESVLVLIGERPGLSSPDSLGAYITWLGSNPESSITDANRNCISNIRTEGLSYAQAAARILYYLQEARARQKTGIELKDPAPHQLASLIANTVHPQIALAEAPIGAHESRP